MTVPAAGQFEVTMWADSVFLTCPNCDIEIWPEEWTLRDLIAAASAHATTHARAEINA